MLNLKDIHSNIKDELQKQQSDFIQLIYNTTPVDRQRVEKVICKIYESLHLNTPREIIWADSPLQAGVLLEILKSDLCLQSLLEMNEIDAIRGIEEKISKWPEGPVLNAFFETGRDRLKVFERELFKSFDNQLALMIRQKVDKEASKFLHKHLEKFIQEKVTEEIGREIFQSFEDYFTFEINLNDFDKDKLQTEEARHKFYRGCFLNGAIATQIGTQKQYHLRTLQIPLFFHYIGRLFLYRFFQEINLFNFDLAKGLVQIYESCGPFWFPFPNTVICSERPSIVCFDLQKKTPSRFCSCSRMERWFWSLSVSRSFSPKKVHFAKTE